MAHYSFAEHFVDSIQQSWIFWYHNYEIQDSWFGNANQEDLFYGHDYRLLPVEEGPLTSFFEDKQSLANRDISTPPATSGNQEGYLTTAASRAPCSLPKLPPKDKAPRFASSTRSRWTLNPHARGKGSIWVKEAAAHGEKVEFGCAHCPGSRYTRPEALKNHHRENHQEHDYRAWDCLLNNPHLPVRRRLIPELQEALQRAEAEGKPLPLVLRERGHYYLP